MSLFDFFSLNIPLKTGNLVLIINIVPQLNFKSVETKQESIKSNFYGERNQEGVQIITPRLFPNSIKSSNKDQEGSSMRIKNSHTQETPRSIQSKTSR